MASPPPAQPASPTWTSPCQRTPPIAPPAITRAAYQRPLRKASASILTRVVLVGNAAVRAFLSGIPCAFVSSRANAQRADTPRDDVPRDGISSIHRHLPRVADIPCVDVRRAGVPGTPGRRNRRHSTHLCVSAA